MKFPFFPKKQQTDPERIFEEDRITANDIIAPASIKINPEYLDMGGRLTKSFFVFSYPRYLSAVWLAPAVNLDAPLDISLYYHPVDTGMVMRQLRKRVTEVQSEIMEREDRGLIRDPE